MCFYSDMPMLGLSTGWFWTEPRLDPSALGGRQRDLKLTADINWLIRFWVWLVVKIAEICKDLLDSTKFLQNFLGFG